MLNNIKDFAEIQNTNPRLAGLINDQLTAGLTCIYCKKKYKVGTEDYEYVKKYGFCLMCEEVNNDYANDAYIEFQSLSDEERIKLMEDYDELTDIYRQ